jgi:hypothetical protein
VGPALDAGAKLKQVALPGAARSINYRFVQLGVDAPARLAGGNLHEAKMIRDKARESLAAIQFAYSHARCEGP